MSFKVPIDKGAKIGPLVAKDKAGNVAQIDPFVVPVWSVSDPSRFTVFPDNDDPLIGHAVPQGVLGVCQVQVTVDADLGQGSKLLTGVIELEAIAGEATVLDIPVVLEELPTTPPPTTTTTTAAPVTTTLPPETTTTEVPTTTTNPPGL